MVVPQKANAREGHHPGREKGGDTLAPGDTLGHSKGEPGHLRPGGRHRQAGRGREGHNKLLELHAGGYRSGGNHVGSPPSLLLPWRAHTLIRISREQVPWSHTKVLHISISLNTHLTPHGPRSNTRYGTCHTQTPLTHVCSCCCCH